MIGLHTFTILCSPKVVQGSNQGKSSWTRLHNWRWKDLPMGNRCCHIFDSGSWIAGGFNVASCWWRTPVSSCGHRHLQLWFPELKRSYKDWEYYIHGTRELCMKAFKVADFRCLKYHFLELKKVLPPMSGTTSINSNTLQECWCVCSVGWTVSPAAIAFLADRFPGWSLLPVAIGDWA
jgi:hypothetical protein